MILRAGKGQRRAKGGVSGERYTVTPSHFSPKTTKNLKPPKKLYGFDLTLLQDTTVYYSTPKDNLRVLVYPSDVRGGYY